jgi:hypothetical protein
MTATPFPLPALTDEDPPIAGEGSLDPLGLALVAERLAENLLPGMRARMRRVRFITISAVGALATEDLFDEIAADGVASPSICFEWLVLEAFARKPEGQPLDASGVPGSFKVRGVLAQGKRLASRNYLKAPSVFGFTGVYLPLARHFRVLDDERRPAGNVLALTKAWERDRNLMGFSDGSTSSDGYRLRVRIRDAVRDSLRSGHCTLEPGSHLWGKLAESLHPLRIGTAERAVLRGWLASEEEPLRAEMARFVLRQEDLGERDLLEAMRQSAPTGELSTRLDAIAAYEEVVRRLHASFTQVCWLSTNLSASGAHKVVADAATDATILACHKGLRGALQEAASRIDRLDGVLSRQLLMRLEPFDAAMPVADYVEQLLHHHVAIQGNKPPRGKRPWLDRHAGGWVVRSQYWQRQAAVERPDSYLHPYRLQPLQAFMREVAA